MEESIEVVKNFPIVEQIIETSIEVAKMMSQQRTCAHIVKQVLDGVPSRQVGHSLPPMKHLWSRADSHCEEDGPKVSQRKGTQRPRILTEWWLLVQLYRRPSSKRWAVDLLWWMSVPRVLCLLVRKRPSRRTPVSTARAHRRVRSEGRQKK